MVRRCSFWHRFSFRLRFTPAVGGIDPSNIEDRRSRGDCGCRIQPPEPGVESDRRGTHPAEPGRTRSAQTGAKLDLGPGRSGTPRQSATGGGLPQWRAADRVSSRRSSEEGHRGTLQQGGLYVLQRRQGRAADWGFPAGFLSVTAIVISAGRPRHSCRTGQTLGWNGCLSDSEAR